MITLNQISLATYFMFLLILAHQGCPMQSPESHIMVVVEVVVT